jgi:site-specific DNA-methyltransferase (adenine-specific)
MAGINYINENEYSRPLKFVSDRIETNKIYNENCLETMAKMPDCFIDLTVTSPPYDDLRNYNGYSFDFENVAKELYRVTKQGGVVVWVVGDATIDGNETGTSFKQALFFKEVGFYLHDTMIYAKEQIAFPSSNRYHQAFEYMFVFSKGKPKTVNLIQDRMNVSFGRSGKVNARMKNGEVKKGEKEVVIREYSERLNWWIIYNQERGIENEHPAVFSRQLAYDHIKTWSNENDLVYDCFMGSGTTAVAAILANRKWIGSEISEQYCNISKQRLEPYLNNLFTNL